MIGPDALLRVPNIWAAPQRRPADNQGRPEKSGRFFIATT